MVVISISDYAFGPSSPRGDKKLGQDSRMRRSTLETLMSFSGTHHLFSRTQGKLCVCARARICVHIPVEVRG